LYLHEQKKYSASAQNTAINAIKFLYEKVWNQPRTVYQLPRSKKPQQLPKVIPQSDLEKIFSSVSNIKHKVILYTCYSAGLRVSEVCKLKLSDIYRATKQFRLEEAKGKKDRMVMLSDKLLQLIEYYYRAHKPQTYLFEGHHGEPYSTRSVQLIFQKAKQDAGVIRKGSIHSLRHSFATHLLESGIDITLIKQLLGHESIRTTMRYTHVSKAKMNSIMSPFDNLNLK
jgi:integrase/recombinase XerD